MIEPKKPETKEKRKELALRFLEIRKKNKLPAGAALDLLAEEYDHTLPTLVRYLGRTLAKKV
jgi:hypothetical protein